MKKSIKYRIILLIIIGTIAINAVKAQNIVYLYGMNTTGQPVINSVAIPTVVNSGSYNDLLNLPTIIQGTKGTSTISGVSLQTAYVITHGLSYTPSQIYIQSTTLAGAALNYVTTITGTTFTVNFAVAPSIGTNNISFYWTAYK